MYKVKRPRIHLACLFGLHDKDLLPHWIRHYVRYAFDTMTIFFHAPALSEEQREGYVRTARENGIDALFATFGFFASGSGRAYVMEHMAKLLPAEDYLVTADSDEFHCMDPATYRDIILDHDAVTGNNRDRWADKLRYADDTAPLAAQFPRYGDIMETHRKKQTVNYTNKVLACRAGIAVDFTGSHKITGTIADCGVYKGCDIDHYRWRPCVLDSFKDKFYYRLQDMVNIMEIFGMKPEDHPFYAELEKREIALQKSKGWVPVKDGAALSPVGAEGLPDMIDVIVKDGSMRDIQFRDGNEQKRIIDGIRD